MDPPALSLLDRPLPKEPSNEKKKLGKNKGKMTKSIGISTAMDKMVISGPTNFSHKVHVGFDTQTGEFTVIFRLTFASILRTLSSQMHSTVQFFTQV